MSWQEKRQPRRGFSEHACVEKKRFPQPPRAGLQIGTHGMSSPAQGKEGGISSCIFFITQATLVGIVSQSTAKYVERRRGFYASALAVCESPWASAALVPGLSAPFASAAVRSSVGDTAVTPVYLLMQR